MKVKQLIERLRELDENLPILLIDASDDTADCTKNIMGVQLMELSPEEDDSTEITTAVIIFNSEL